MSPVRLGYLFAIIGLATHYASAQSRQLRMLTQTERGQLTSVDGLPGKSVTTGETNHANSKIETGVYAVDNTRSGFYIVAAARTGFKRPVHSEYVQCGQFSFTAATVTMYEGSPIEMIKCAPLPNRNSSPPSTAPFESVPRMPSQNARSSNQDPGVDLGVVIAERVNLREGPSTSSRVIRELRRGEIVALVSRTSIGPWYDVIQVESGIEGWINGNTIRVRYTQKRKAGPVFQERATGTYENPEVRITNDSAQTLYLKVGGDERIVIGAHSAQTVSKPAGTYSFYASSPGVIPAFGEHTFQIGRVYEWTFYIVTTYK